MDLARELANGIAAETVLRSCADNLDADWNEYLTIFGDLGQPVERRDAAYAKLQAIMPYRSLITAVRDIADREPVPVSPVIPIGDRT